MSDARTIAVYNRQSDDYAAMMDREAAQDKIIGRFISACPAGGQVLDLGCGSGHYAKRMAEAGLQVEAIDASQAMVDLTAQLPGVSVRLGLFDDLNAKDRYDGIWAYFSLLHANRSDLPGHLNRIAKALRPGGVFFIGMKRGSGAERDSIDRYYEYYERDELESMLTEAGLTPVDHWYGKGAGLSGHVAGWVVIHAHA